MDSSSTSSKSLKILQWNAHSVIPKLDRLKALLSKNNIDIFCICETWLVEEKFFRVPFYNILRKDRQQPYGGVMIGIRNGIEFKSISVPTSGSVECVGVSVKVNDKFVAILSTYIPPNGRCTLADLQNSLSQIKEPCFLLGDLNAHGISWGSLRDNARANILYDIIDEYQMSILNDGSHTRIACPPNVSSCVDISLCSNSLALYCSWKVVDDPNDSDHLPIITEYTPTIATDTLTEDFIFDMTKNIDWNKFRDLLSVELSSQKNLDPVKTRYENFSNALIRCLMQSQTKRFKSGKNKIRDPTFWWDRECSQKLEEKSNAFKIFRSTGLREHYFEYKKTEAAFTRTTKSKKRNYWKNFVESLDKDVSLSTLWSVARKMRNCKTRTESMTEYSEQWIDQFVEKVCPPYVPTNVKYFSNSRAEIFGNLGTPLSLYEFDMALSSSNNTAPGLDKIKMAVLKNLPEVAREALLQIFNDLLEQNVCPDDWRQIKVVSIQKPGKNPSLPESYRPICLLSCIRKLLERMLLNRLELWAEKQNVFSETQYGFRKGRGTRDCLALLASNAQLSINKKQECASVFLDISGAYDSIVVNILVDKMDKLGLPTKLVNFLSNLLSFKVMKFYNKNSLQTVRYSYFGIPQGSCLSPFLYNIYTNDIDRVLPNGCVLYQFADDAVLSISGKDRAVIEHFMQQSLNRIEDWASENGLTFSVEKTKSILFTNKRNPPNLELSLYGEKIENVTEHKYLGIWFDYKMTWKAQITYLQKVCSKRINFLRTITGTWWGAHPNDMLMLYKTTILSVLEYGCFTFGSACNTHLHKLEKIQYRCLRISIGLMHSTHTKSVEVIAGIVSLQTRFFELNCRFLIKTIAEKHPVVDILDDLFEINPSSRLLSAYRHCITIDIKNPPTTRNFSFGIETHSFKPDIDESLLTELKNIPTHHLNRVAQNIFQHKIATENKQSIFYTDGSRIDGTAGFGVYNENISYFFGMQEPCTVFSAEITAILFTLKLIQKLPPAKYTICSDSLSALRALQLNQIRGSTNQTVLLIKEVIISLIAQGFGIKLLWIPAHSNIYGNDQADNLAKLGARRGMVFQHGTEIREYSYLIREHITEDWQLSWDRSDMGRWCYSIIPRVSKNPWFKNLETELGSRMFIKTFSRIMSNHYGLKSHLYRINLTDSNMCECGVSYEDFDHVLWSCERYAEKREKLKNDLRNMGKNEHPTIRDILGCKDFKMLQLIHVFISENKIRI